MGGNKMQDADWDAEIRSRIEVIESEFTTVA